jgi:hypothetical protein
MRNLVRFLVALPLPDQEEDEACKHADTENDSNSNTGFGTAGHP